MHEPTEVAPAISIQSEQRPSGTQVLKNIEGTVQSILRQAAGRNVAPDAIRCLLTFDLAFEYANAR